MQSLKKSLRKSRHTFKQELFYFTGSRKDKTALGKFEISRLF